MIPNMNEAINTERLLVEKLKEKDYSEYKCKCVIFFVIIICDLIFTWIYCKYFRRYIITERTSYHNIPYFPFVNFTFVLNFDIKKEQIGCNCFTFVRYGNGSETDLKEVNWKPPGESYNGESYNYFLLDDAFEKEDLNLNEGDNLYILFGCTEKNYTKLKKKGFYLSYMAYFLNSNNQIENKLIIDKLFNLEEEIPLSSKNEALLIYKYKKISNSINNGTKTQNFSSITPYENSKFILYKHASLLPSFAIIIEDTKELRILEVIPDFTFLKFFIMILGSISFIINIFVAIYCLNKNRIRVHSSQIEASIRDNLPNNEFNNNNNGIIAELNNQNA